MGHSDTDFFLTSARHIPGATIVSFLVTTKYLIYLDILWQHDMVLILFGDASLLPLFHNGQHTSLSMLFLFQYLMRSTNLLHLHLPSPMHWLDFEYHSAMMSLYCIVCRHIKPMLSCTKHSQSDLHQDDITKNKIECNHGNPTHWRLSFTPLRVQQLPM